MFFGRKKSWIRIFDSARQAEGEIPLNHADTISVNGKKICIAHTSEGFFAVNDKCPHNGASLGHGFCTEENSIVCPMHRYHFDLRTGRTKSGIADVVRTYPLEIREDGVYIEI